jgi:hypothetical protein
MEQRDELERAGGTIGDVEGSESNESRVGDRRELDRNGPPSPSPATQIGRAEQTGGTSASGLEAGVESREGWPMPDQSDTPVEWPEPTID